MYQTIKLIKLQHTSQTLSETQIKVKVGDINSGKMKDWPQIGESFTIVKDLYLFQTTTVTEIIDDRTFKTRNSVYKIVTLEDERHERIKIILD